MAKYRVLVTGIVLRDGTTAMGNTLVDESKILGDMDALVKGGFIGDDKPAKKLSAKEQKAADDAAHTKLLTDYKEAFGKEAPAKAPDEEIEKALEDNTEIEEPVV